jgi:hypothetical protein
MAFPARRPCLFGRSQQVCRGTEFVLQRRKIGIDLAEARAHVMKNLALDVRGTAHSSPNQPVASILSGVSPRQGRAAVHMAR